MATVKVIKPFADKQNGKKVRAVGSSFSASLERATELADKGFVEIVGEDLADQTFTDKGGQNSLTDTSSNSGAEGAGADELVAKGELVKHIVTQEDMDNNPSLAESGTKVGDEIEFPAGIEMKVLPLAENKEQGTAATTAKEGAKGGNKGNGGKKTEETK